VKRGKSGGVCAVVCNWNKKDYVLKCVESVRRSGYPSLDIVVVDNASTDGSAAALKARFPGITVIENSENLGGTGGFNTGLRWVLERDTYDYVWLLDNDVTAAPDALEKLVETMTSSPDFGIVGSVILKMDEPGVVHELGGFVDRETFTLPLNDHDARMEDLPSRHAEVDYVPACSILVDVDKMREIGIMDEGFFLYYDEVEWCSRFQKKRYKIIAAPGSKIWHKGGAGNRGNNLPIYFQWRNKFTFFLRLLEEEAERQRFVHTFFDELVTAMYTSRFTGKVNAYKTFVRAAADILKGQRGKPDGKRVFSRDTEPYGKFYPDFRRRFPGPLEKMIVLEDRLRYRAPLETFVKSFQPSEVIRVSSADEWTGGPVSRGLTVVACDHIFTAPNAIEAEMTAFLAANDGRVCYLDSHSNFFPGYSAMKAERAAYAAYIREMREIYLPLYLDFI
jgi:GT2 family glycosyltransferase